MKHIFLAAFLFFAVHACAQDAQPQKPMVVYPYPEQQPAPEFDLPKYLSENIHYPDKARKHNIEGRVIVQFIVTETGAIDSVKVVRGIGAGCDDEAARVVKSMPAWKPGKQNGKPVNTRFTLPVVFYLENKPQTK